MSYVIEILITEDNHRLPLEDQEPVMDMRWDLEINEDQAHRIQQGIQHAVEQVRGEITDLDLDEME